MNNLPLISVIVPIYNVEKYIDKSINSIINQSYKNLDIILVDDGSTDLSGNIADTYEKKDKRIRVIHKQNGGLSDARNVGMKSARGEYICFFDSDDYVEEDLFEKIVRKLDKKDNVDVIIWGFFVDYVDDNEILKKRIKRKVPKYIDLKNISFEMLNIIGYAWNKLYRLEYLNNNNLKFEKGLSRIEDTEFNSRALIDANIMFIKGCFNHYIQRSRITLGTKKYSNQTELDSRFVESHVNLLTHWNANKKHIKRIIDNDYYLFFRRNLTEIIKNKNYSNKEKNEKINKIFIDEEKMNIFNKDFKVKGFKFLIIKFLIKYKMMKTLNLLIR